MGVSIVGWKFRVGLAVAAGLFACATVASDQGERLARELAKSTVPKLQAAEAALRVAVTGHDAALFRERFELPLQQLEQRWSARIYRSRGMTDRDVAAHGNCASAITDLLQYGQAVARQSDSKWAAYRMQRYKENLSDCKGSINSPERYKVE